MVALLTHCRDRGRHRLVWKKVWKAHLLFCFYTAWVSLERKSREQGKQSSSTLRLQRQMYTNGTDPQQDTRGCTEGHECLGARWPPGSMPLVWGGTRVPQAEGSQCPAGHHSWLWRRLCECLEAEGEVGDGQWTERHCRSDGFWCALHAKGPGPHQVLGSSDLCFDTKIRKISYVFYSLLLFFRFNV